MRSRQMSGCALGLALLLSPGAGTSLFVTRHALHSHGYGVTARASSRALCLCVPGALVPPLPLRLRLPLSFITGAMARRTVQDMLMQAARAQARGSRLPASQKGKAAATVEMAVDEKADASSSKSEELKKAKAQEEVPSVDDAINALLKKHLDFDPKAAAFWKAGDRVPFLLLARAFDLISNESGRLAMTEILGIVFRTVIATSPSDLLSVVYVSANRVAPAHEGVELGIGDASIIKVLAETFGKKDDISRLS